MVLRAGLLSDTNDVFVDQTTGCVLDDLAVGERHAGDVVVLLQVRMQQCGVRSGECKRPCDLHCRCLCRIRTLIDQNLPGIDGALHTAADLHLSIVQ